MTTAVVLFKLDCGEGSMAGTILEVINGGSLWLLVVSTGRRVVDQVVEPRYMCDIVAGEGLSHPFELRGREVKLADDGLTVSFV
jgi:hypothetical protein